jgi:2-methylcitrate dehydratase PrpD
MSLSLALAESGRRSAAPQEIERLRVLSLCNVAAAIGDLGSATPLVRNAGTAPNVAAERARRYAMAFHARTQDDFYAPGRVHVGAIVLPVAIALADEVDEERFFAALVAGYDLTCRVSSAYSAEAQARGMRPSGFFGPLAAAATAAAARDLDVGQTTNAIGLAAVMSAGTNQAWVSGTDEWLLEVGAAARSGIEAVELTLAGARASDESLEGRAGWARAFFGDEGAERLKDTVARADSGLMEVAIKPYPVSGIAQVLTWLGTKAHAEVSSPAKIEARVSSAEYGYPGSSNVGPFKGRSDALMSIAFCVACAATDGYVGIERLEKPNDETVAGTLAKVTVVPDEKLGEGEAVLEVTDEAGERHSFPGNDRELLFRSWDEIDIVDLAARSEAGQVQVERAAAAVLDTDCVVLAMMLDELTLVEAVR